MREDVAEAIAEGLSMYREGEVLKVFEEFIKKQPKGKKVNPKKVRALATKITPLCAPHIINGLIHSVLTVRDPVKYLEGCFNDVGEYATIIKSFIESGHQGMIQVDRDCYPVKLVCPEKWLTEGDPWHPDDEQLIGADACNAWMKEYDRGYFFGRVVLFSDFGFSGIPREFEMRCTTNTKNLKRYPGTRYYTK